VTYHVSNMQQKKGHTKRLNVSEFHDFDILSDLTAHVSEGSTCNAV